MADDRNDSNNDEQISTTTGTRTPKYSKDTDFDDFQQHVLLANGTTVSIEDYDPDVHGRYVVEDEEAYNRRLGLRPNGMPIAPVSMPTTIPGLQTASPEEIRAATSPTPPPPPQPQALSDVGKPVVTQDKEESEAAKAAAKDENAPEVTRNASRRVR